MLNKIYKSTLNYIRENIIGIVVYLFVLFIILFPVNYYIITGGGTIDANKRVTINSSNKSKGSFSFCYVAEIKGTIFTYLLSYIVPHYERESTDNYKINREESTKDINFRNTMLMNETNNNAIFVAYKKADKYIKLKSSKNYIYSIEDEARTNLKIGDEVLSVDGVDVDSLDTLRKIVNSKNVNDKVNVKVKRNNKEYNKYAYIYKGKDRLYIGVSLLNDREYITDPKVKIKFKNSESGPSGGLMLTLQIYNDLVKKDITKGLKIAGTGTIDIDGDVGEIDGVKHKLEGAVKDKQDVFLVPDGRNYKEALKEKKKYKYKIKIINVKTFDDALSKLSNMN